jgi:hypothetical protein
MDRAAPRRGPVLVVVAVLLGALAGTWLGLVQGVHGRSSEAATAAQAAPAAHTGRVAAAPRAVTSTSRAAGTVSAALRRGAPGRALGHDSKPAKPEKREPVGPGQHSHGKDKDEVKRHEGHD